MIWWPILGEEDKNVPWGGTFHKTLKSRRVLEREKTDKSRQNRPDPP